jgi:hypothetical protein
MTRFQPDLGGVKAGMPVYDRGDYELKISAVKPIFYYNEEKGYDVAGAQVNLEMVGKMLADGSMDRTEEGESVAPNRLYVHSQKAIPMVKQFFMAALGYPLEDEDKFNKEVAANLDISVTPGEEGEEATLGTGWARLTGQRILCTLDKRVHDGREQQDHKAFMPIKK